MNIFDKSSSTLESKLKQKMKLIKFILFSIIIFGTNSCSVYNLQGQAKLTLTHFIGFQNNAELIEPGIDRTFTLELKI
jgi:hypothetical protein